jgi:hypothetical protein
VTVVVTVLVGVRAVVTPAVMPQQLQAEAYLEPSQAEA